jgi:aryl-alcohol dehydrogenase-like predicted oxidoreductase
MERRRLGTTDLQLPVFGLGCGGFGGIGSAIELFGQGEDQKTAFAIMDRALDLGIDYFDTANSYGGGRSEQIVGRWLAARKARGRILLSTKVFNPVGPDREDAGLSRAAILKQVDESLRRLQTDHVDLYLAHGVDQSVPIAETLEAFDAVVRAGKAGHVACSNVDGTALVAALEAAPSLGVPGYRAVQNGYSLLDREAETEVLPTAADAGLGFTAFSPLSGGWLTGKYGRDVPAPAGSRMTLRPGPYEQLRSEVTFRQLDALAAEASRRGVEMAALALAWVVSHPAVTGALIGPRSLAQFGPAEAALDLRLTPADRDAVSDVLAAA